ncbi:Sugar phosphatase YidA [compost metagenome]
MTNEIIRLGREHSLLPFLFALDHTDQERVLHERLSRFGDMAFYKSRPDDPRFMETSPLACPDTIRTLILTYIGLLEELEPLKTVIEQKLGKQVHIHFMRDPYIENHYFLEFSHPMANKREGLLKWSELVNCKPEEVIVFGDNLNDAGMFEVAGIKVAVSNAHPRITEMSSAVIESNDEDGVAKYVYEAVLEQI